MCIRDRPNNTIKKLGAIEVINEATEKAISPQIQTLLRPKVSAIAPAGIIIALTASIDPTVNHCAVGISAPNSLAMEGITIAVADCSTTVMNVPIAIAQ